MKKYYIYHIKGKKIGVSINPYDRTKRQGCLDFEILEVHTDIDMVSKREMELQKQYGYKVDTIPYSHSYKMQQRGDVRANGKKGADKYHEMYSLEERLEIQKKGAFKKRKLNEQQLQFIKDNWAPSTNQFDRQPGKLGKPAIAKALGVPYRQVNWAIKKILKLQP